MICPPLSIYPVDRKFCKNHSISHHFQNKCVSAFYAEIQHGLQKWQENDFWNKVVDETETAKASTVSGIVNIFLFIIMKNFGA